MAVTTTMPTGLAEQEAWVKDEQELNKAQPPLHDRSSVICESIACFQNSLA